MQLINEVAGVNTELVLWNPTEEKIVVRHDAKTYPLGPNQKMRAGHSTAMDCVRDFGHKGLVVLPSAHVTEEYLENKRTEAYNAIYDFDLQCLKDWDSHMVEERRRNGDSMLGESRHVKEVKRKVYLGEKRLGLAPQMAPEIYEELERIYGEKLDGKKAVSPSMQAITQRKKSPGRKRKQFISPEVNHVNVTSVEN